jgi:hypothetical protein
MERINVVGTSCSGKTTLALAVARRLDLACVELDALFWGPAWEPVPPDVFRSRVADAIAADRWVLDGGYSTVRPLIWERADTVVWLDYPMGTVLGRWARRTAARIRDGREFWPGTGNRESLRHALSRGGLLSWILTTHRQRRRTMLAQLDARPGIQGIRLRSPSEAERWLRHLRVPGRGDDPSHGSTEG